MWSVYNSRHFKRHALLWWVGALLFLCALVVLFFALPSWPHKHSAAVVTSGVFSHQDVTLMHTALFVLGVLALVVVVQLFLRILRASTSYAIISSHIGPLEAKVVIEVEARPHSIDTLSHEHTCMVLEMIEYCHKELLDAIDASSDWNHRHRQPRLRIDSLNLCAHGDIPAGKQVVVAGIVGGEHPDKLIFRFLVKPKDMHEERATCIITMPLK